jgi:hypothetical protein
VYNTGNLSVFKIIRTNTIKSIDSFLSDDIKTGTNSFIHEEVKHQRIAGSIPNPSIETTALMMDAGIKIDSPSATKLIRYKEVIASVLYKIDMLSPVAQHILKFLPYMPSSPFER